MHYLLMLTNLLLILLVPHNDGKEVVLKTDNGGVSACGHGLWECNNEECINVDYLCDGVQDCNDGSDESESQCDGGFGCPYPIHGNGIDIELQIGQTVMNYRCQEVTCEASGVTVTSPLCVEHAECVLEGLGNIYGCICEEGYHGDGQTLCAADTTDHCLECPEHAHCVTDHCECEPGYTPTNTVDGLSCIFSAFCQAIGDPHYTTWDGVRVNYQGLCRHLLAGVCRNTTLEAWSVWVNNVRLPGSSRSVSYSVYAEVTVYGHVIRLTANRVLIIDGVPTTQNYVSLLNGRIVVRYAPGTELQLQTDFGLIVRQHGYASTVIAPEEYANHLCGICGDWDGDQVNDEGRDLSEYQEPGYVEENGCNVPDDNVTCTPEILAAAEETCNMIFNQTTLALCNDIPNSPNQDFYDDCVVDICAGGDPLNVVCETLEAFVVLCEELTQTVLNGVYREEAGCIPECPDNSTYSIAMSLDQATCDNPEGDYALNSNSGEGCLCDDGFVFEGDACVEADSCGCSLPLHTPSYLPRGTSYLNANCTTLYQCDADGNLSTTDIECAENASCVRNQNFINECVCDEDYDGDGFVECEEEEEGNGDPHFIVTSHDQYHTKLCYDVSGNDGDVLLIARNERNKLQINGEVYIKKTNKDPQAFFSNFAIFYGDVKVVIGRDDITINDIDRYTWDEMFTAPLFSDMEAFVTSRWGTDVKVELSSDLLVHITRSKTIEGDYYLGIMITHSQGLSEQTTGVIGNFLKSSFKPVTSGTESFVEFLDRSLIIPVQQVQRYSAVHKGLVNCWHYSVKTQQTYDHLLGDRESYTVPELNYHPF